MRLEPRRRKETKLSGLALCITPERQFIQGHVYKGNDFSLCYKNPVSHRLLSRFRMNSSDQVPLSILE